MGRRVRRPSFANGKPSPIRRSLAFALPLLALLTANAHAEEGTRPTRLKARPGEQPPPGYVVSESPRLAFALPGAGMWVLAYGMGLGIAAAGGFANRSGALAIPLAGPWVTLALRNDDCSSSIVHCGIKAWANEGLVIDGVYQIIGVGLIAAGVAWPRTVWELDETATVRVDPWMTSASSSRQTATTLGLTLTVVQ